MIKEQDPAIQKAEKVLEYLSSNEEMIRLYELREKAIHVLWSILGYFDGGA